MEAEKSALNEEIPVERAICFSSAKVEAGPAKSKDFCCFELVSAATI